MPSVADIQQQSTKVCLNSNNGKSTPTLQQQNNSTSSGNQIDTTNVDPITQAILLLEKKQRNLGKRKEKLESYQQEAKSGKELNKDQTEALAKYGDVVGQIECVKDIYEQIKKIQTDSAKSQKRILKQAAEEKRLFAAQRLREYVQIRYLIEHRPSSLKTEESTLLDALAPVVIPSDNLLNTINRSIDTILAIYQGGSSTTIKNLTGRTSQEVREILEQLIQTNTFNNQQQTTENNNTNDLPSIDHTQVIETNSSEYPLQFDTRNQKNIPLQQIIQDNTFFPGDILTTNTNTQNQQQSTTNQDNQSNDNKQFLQTQNISQQLNYDQENSSNIPIDDQQQQHEEQWQQRRSNNANYNGSTNRNYNRATTQNNSNQQHWRGGARGGYYNNSYNGGQQRQFNDNNNRPGLNSNYRGNRGGNYRGGNRGGNNTHYNGNGYQKSSQYQQNTQQQ